MENRISENEKEEEDDNPEPIIQDHVNPDPIFEDIFNPDLIIEDPEPIIENHEPLIVPDANILDDDEEFEKIREEIRRQIEATKLR